MRMSAQVIQKAGGGVDINALSAILTYNSKIALDALPDVFSMACKLLDPAKIRSAMKSPDSASAFKNGSWDLATRTTRSAVLSLFILGHANMISAVGDQRAAFTPLIRKHWPNLFSSMKLIYEYHKGGRLKKPKTKLGLASLVCKALLSLFRNKPVLARMKKQDELRKFVWTLWLYGGPASYEESGIVSNSVAAACLSCIYMGGSNDHTDVNLFADLTGVCEPFGGNTAIADVALTGVYRSMLSKDRVTDVMEHFNVLSFFFADDQGRDIMGCIYDLDGMAKLIEGLTELATTSRAELEHRGMDFATSFIIKILQHLVTRNHRNAEQAGRCGILQMIMAFVDKTKEDIPQSVLDALRELLTILPRYLVYHSVISAFAVEMRKLTEGENPEDSCVGKLFGNWRKLKSTLIDRYSIKRFYDIVVEPDLQGKYCNDVG